MSEHEHIGARISFLHEDDQYSHNLSERRRLLSLIEDLIEKLIRECLEAAEKYFPTGVARPLLITKDPKILKVLQQLPTLTHQLKKTSANMCPERKFEYVKPLTKDMETLLYCLIQFILYVLPRQVSNRIPLHVQSVEAFVPDFSMSDDEGLLKIIHELRNCFTIYDNISESNISNTVATTPLIKVDLARLKLVENMLRQE